MTEPSPDTDSQRTPYWRLLAILGSTLRIEPALAYWLYDAALELHDSGGDKARLDGKLAEGELRRLEHHVLLGTLRGPGFEATLDTAEGRAMVRFLVTREGLEDHRRKTELASKLVH